MALVHSVSASTSSGGYLRLSFTINQDVANEFVTYDIYTLIQGAVWISKDNSSLGALSSNFSMEYSSGVPYYNRTEYLTGNTYTFMTWVVGRRSDGTTGETVFRKSSYEAFYTSTDTTFTPTYYPEVLYQWIVDKGNWIEQAGDCVANACVTLYDIFTHKKTGASSRFSVQWVFGNRTSGGDAEGMFVDEALDNMKSYGMVFYNQFDNAWRQRQLDAGYTTYGVYPDVNWYYDQNDADRDYTYVHRDGSRTLVLQNSSALASTAQQYRIGGYQLYRQLNSNIDTIKNAVKNNGGVIIDCLLPYNFWYGNDIYARDTDSPFNDGSKDSPDWSKQIGAHALVILGWKQYNGKNYWICQNGWGNWWGDNGLCYVPFDWMFIRHYYVIQDKISFAWSTKSDLQQGKLNVKATDWNKLTQNINNIRASIGLSSLTFTTVNAGDYIYYNYFNQVVSALENLKARGTLHYTFTLIEVSRDNYILINTHILNLETAVNST